jgi:hypothetical protein
MNREDLMHSLWRSLLLVAVLTAGFAGASAAERRAELVRFGDVQIEVIAEGEGPNRRTAAFTCAGLGRL